MTLRNTATAGEIETLASGEDVARQLAFGQFELDLDAHRFTRCGTDVVMQPLTLALLAYLVENRGRIVSRDELLTEVWNGAHVCESAIMQAVCGLRRTLGDDPRRQAFIQTVRGRGYRFTGGVVRSV